ncbi:hypothetical protein O6H91_15G069400 [Diphasiastrum complanatum]|uniref:Uncharacterized protein n=1 Tax=Diphasiastrum complanatum TaxID=34168 RepID=A0ACC2BJC9_DIPCM|nr:hypothetical protein O6H91_15G069400 [Diphasiastrum complanatum]
MLQHLLCIHSGWIWGESDVETWHLRGKQVCVGGRGVLWSLHTQVAEIGIKILRQGSTASPCERNWNTFSLIHTKRRNRLKHILVFVHFNLRVLDKIKAREFEKIELTLQQVEGERDEDPRRGPIASVGG